MFEFAEELLLWDNLHSTPFDYGYLILRAEQYGLKFPFSYRTIDLQPIAFTKYLQVNGAKTVEKKSPIA